MDTGQRLIELGKFNILGLQNVILGLDDAPWIGNKYRQDTYEVHEQTRSIVMLFTDGSGWPDIEVVRESGWDLLAKQALPLMQEILDRHYPPGGTILRAMAVKLIPGGIIKPHRDSHPSFHFSHRIHVPLVTNPRVRFILDGRPYKLEVGKVYEINNQKQHSVMNKGEEGRIHFIFDYLPPGNLGQTG